MVELVNKYRKDGSMKSKNEIDGELKTLLQSYRRQNLLLNDRLFDIQNNVLPRQLKLIEEQKDTIKRLAEEMEQKKSTSKSWFFN